MRSFARVVRLASIVAVVWGTARASYAQETQEDDPIPIEDLLPPDHAPPVTPSPQGSLRAYIRAQCRVAPIEQTCTFSNGGNALGHGCARVTITGPGGETESREVCSGPLAAGASITRALTFDGASPASVCTRDGRVDFGACRLSVEMIDVGLGEGAPMWVAIAMLVLPWLFLLLAAAWVYFDARRRKDPNAAVWAAGVLLLCIVAFPAYLLAGRKSPRETALDEDAA